MIKPLAKKVLLIGWDAADWKIINPLMDSGQLPALENFVNHGVIGNLATLDPPMSPMLWTSIATGKHADKHGILNFSEPAPQAAGIRPVSVSSRKVKAIWNILTQKNFKTHVVGWWPSHPAEPINGVYISNFYQRAHAPIEKPWPLRQGTVHPEKMAKIFDELRIHPAELTEAHILPFVPEAAKVDQEKDKRLEMLARIIADCATIHSATTWIMENEEWDFLAVYYDALDHFCHGFMNFHPPRMKGVPKNLFDIYKNVVNGGYRFHDMMLDRLIQLAGPDTTIILVSDHGFHSDHLRPKGVPKEPAGPAWQHRSYGIIGLKGPGIKEDERIYGATLLDIIPTILNLFGLPVGQDMDGKTLVQSYKKPVTPDYIQSWEKVEGECGMHPPNIQHDPYAEQEAMDQLIALGYVEKPDENKQKAIDRTINESQFYLARVYINKHNHTEALPILKNLHEKRPDQIRYAFHLAKCYQVLGKLRECRNIVEKIIKLEKKVYPQLNLLQGSLYLAEGLYHQALEYLLKAEEAEPRMPTLHQQIGKVYLQMNRLDEAERTFFKALKIDPDSHIANHGLSQVFLKKRQYEDAAYYALNAIGLLYHYPVAHFHLGLALIQLKKYQRAAEALEVCLAMAPGMKQVRKILIRLYRVRLKQNEKANEHNRILSELKNKNMKNNDSRKGENNS
jgi:predicted AlkP superfamily phosphohydrolase/phosphomutase/Tfp pilus assembly protein PilF